MEHCTLCPRHCNARRTPEGGNGFCGLGSTLRLARMAPHYWEEPPISGVRGTGALFFSGCTLRCAYFTPAQLAEHMRRLVNMGVHTMSFITATPFVEGILEALDLYHPPVPLVWNTSGYETVETLRRLEGVMDVYLPDLKHFSSRMGQLCAKAPDYFEVASAAITEMVRQVGAPQYDEDGIMRQGVLIRHLILPGLTGESIALLDWVHDHLPGIPVSLMRQYVPLNGVDIPGLTRTITPREYRRVRDHMRALELPGYEQEAASASEDFVPLFGQDESYI